MNAEVRPSKKQRELLSFIEGFIGQHGYGPSYREIMRGVGYKSVSTVATHVDNLIAKGHLAKKDHSARSLEVVKPTAPQSTPRQPNEREKWLLHHINLRLTQAEDLDKNEAILKEAETLIGSLHILGFKGLTQEVSARLQALQNTKSG